MMGVTHAAAGALAGATVAHFTGGNLALCMGVGALAGLLPDIDSPGSTIGRRVWPVSAFVKATTRHRGATHTVWFCLAAALGLGALSPVAGADVRRYFHFHAWPAASLVGTLVFLGALTHLVLDACTPSGIRPLAPLSWHPRGPVKTGGLLEFPLMFVFFLACLKTARIF
jgi:inner membrane protein